jgi:2-methylcitrate dehydratase PrpD
MQDHQISVFQIAQVIAHVHQGAIDVLGPVTDPQTIHQSKFSMGFVLALIAHHGRAALADFTEPALKDPSIREFHDRVTMELDSRIDAAYPRHWMGRVTVQLKSGKTLECSVDTPKGDPENTLSRAELEDKALRLASFSGAASVAEMQGLFKRIWNLHQETSVRHFLKSL